MASQAATVDLLVKKAKFEPPVAMAVAEAIDNAMTESQFVTVPILDARLAEFRADIRDGLLRQEHTIDGTRVSLENKIDTTRKDLETKIDTTRVDLENKIDATRIDLERKIDATRVDLDRKIDAGFAKVEVGFANVGINFAHVGGGLAKLQEVIAGLSAQMATKADLERTKAELVRWVFVTMVGNAVLGAASALIVDALRHH
jgi:hypothetical protein